MEHLPIQYMENHVKSQDIPRYWGYFGIFHIFAIDLVGRIMEHHHISPWLSFQFSMVFHMFHLHGAKSHGPLLYQAPTQPHGLNGHRPQRPNGKFKKRNDDWHWYCRLIIPLIMVNIDWTTMIDIDIVYIYTYIYAYIYMHTMITLIKIKQDDNYGW